MLRIVGMLVLAIVMASEGRAHELASSSSIGNLRIEAQSDPACLTVSAVPSAISVIDGDTFWLGIFKIRLKDIDTPEPDQSCRKGAVIVNCADDVRRTLERILKRGRVFCSISFDRYGRPALSYNRYLATCQQGGVDIGARLIRNGWAYVSPNSENTGYKKALKEAVRAQTGLHIFEHMVPWTWRKLKRSPVPMGCAAAKSKYCKLETKTQSSEK